MNSEKFEGIIHAIILALVVGIILLEAWFFRLSDPTWSVISGVVSSELQIDQARTLIFDRILATLLGVVFAVIFLILFGSGYFSIIGGVVFITLMCHYAARLKNYWKLAPATGAIILMTNLHQQSVTPAEAMALKRAFEVALGSLTAGAVTLIVGTLWEKIKTRYFES
jgi:uncharacterized membrane protein YccC